MAQRYILNHPDDIDVDITNFVQQGLQDITELAFEIERVTVPSSGDIRCDNTTGFFEFGQGFFNAEITRYILKVDDDGIDLFVGLVSDIVYSDNIASLKISSVINSVIQMAIPVGLIDYTFTGTPAAFLKDIFLNQAVLPGLFVDSIGFDALDIAEQARGIEIDVLILATEKENLSDIVQATYKLSGDYVFSQRGILNIQRVGNFTSLDPDFIWTQDNIVAGSVKRRRPVNWQKTRVVVPTTSGTVARNMADVFIAEGPSILDEFKEKTLETDGLGGKIQHTSTASAIEAMNDLLGWRGFARWQLQVDIDTVDPVNRSILQSVPLFSKNRFEYRGGCFVGILVERKLQAEKASLLAYSLTDPLSDSPGLREHPNVINEQATVLFSSLQRFDIEYFLDGDASTTISIGPTLHAIIVDNRAQRALFARDRKSDSECGSNFSQWYKVEHQPPQAPFIAGLNLASQIV